jgi:hypothetical protein
MYQDKPENVDQAALKTLLMTEGERMTVAEFDSMLREVLPPPPPEDPKKKKRRAAAAAAAKKKKGKKGKGGVEEVPEKIDLPMAYFIEMMPKKAIEQQKTLAQLEAEKKKRRKR